ncbi:ArsR/SmtB family transcription factor [Actinomadura montaniterrae]|uniref:Winged helix-turn-helix transcriptional regulator n=1 Tax=Actinomadura montaniterrae TaxID=1803903 RepID=A0A6L3VEX7_9ACTN|nr:ArsR family transcriptional regulator [Actinomadura montaniterrae]KAB2363597.1 winged helix-turn-helix transcriptional regulator [Actinomadura montaniterrae]
MYEFRLGVQDLAETSFGMSPLFELVFSLRPRVFPGKHPEHLPWVRETAAAYARLDTDLLDVLHAPHGWIPDFLTPRPSGIGNEIADDLAVLRETPPGIVRHDITAAYRHVPVPPVLSGDPSALLDRICTAFEAYWDACVEPYWTRMRAVLEADLVHRARRLTFGGAAALFAELDDRITWTPGLVRLAVPSGLAPERAVDVAGRGLVLVPCLFLRGAITMIDEKGPPPLICYPARGRGAIWEHAAPAGPAALAGIVGARRAELLVMLAAPASTTDLARRLGVTPGAISHHLTALHAGGLLNRTRAGRSVLYMRSPLGDSLVR